MASIANTLSSCLYLSMMGMVSVWYVPKRFRMLSMLSSLRPLVSPRAKRRFSNSASLASKKRTPQTAAASPTFSCQPTRFSRFLGKPSIRKQVFPPFCFAAMASLSSFTVMDVGTILPSLMKLLMRSPSLDVGSFLASRRQSPAEMWAQLWNAFVTFAHCVPFPEPGPPSTNSTFGRDGDPAAESALHSSFTEDTKAAAFAPTSSGAAPGL
mmetsp:Transcript_10573/g.27995  ORF Transcript_10573/g.27995 Transcript_10573/m.27995 type:complete len:211 (+) Transcript_10573:364-996(+)